MFLLKLQEFKIDNKLNKINNHIKEQSHEYKSIENNYIVKLEEFDEMILNVIKKLI